MAAEAHIPSNNSGGSQIRDQPVYSKMIVGAVVWCWVKGYPWWPAVIRDPNRVYSSLNEADRKALPALCPESRLVEFFNDNNRVYVASLDKLRLYTNDMSLLSQAGPEYRTPIAKACDEADKYRQALGQLNAQSFDAVATTAKVSLNDTLDYTLAQDYRRDRMRSRVTTKRSFPSQFTNSTLHAKQTPSGQAPASQPRQIQPPISPKRPSRTRSAKTSPIPSRKGIDEDANPHLEKTGGHPPWTTPLSIEPDTPPKETSPRLEKPNDDAEIPMKLRVRGQLASAAGGEGSSVRKKPRTNLNAQQSPGKGQTSDMVEDRRSERSRAVVSQPQNNNCTTNSPKKAQRNLETDNDCLPRQAGTPRVNGRRHEDDDDIDDVQDMDVEDNSLESLRQNGRRRTGDSIGLDEDGDEYDDIYLEIKFADDMDFVKKRSGTMMKWVTKAKRVVEQVPNSLAKLENLKQQQSDLTKSVDKLRITEERLKTSVKAQGSLLELLQQQINNTKSELSESESKVESSKQEAERLEKTVSNYRSEVARLKRSLTQMRKESGLKIGRTRDNSRRSTGTGSSGERSRGSEMEGGAANKALGSTQSHEDARKE